MKRLAFAAVAGLASLSSAQWTLFNGHYYEAIYTPNGITFADARAAAQTLVAPNGAAADLVSCNTTAENAYAFSLVDDPKYWYVNSFNAAIGPWIGLYQPNNTGDFVWVDGTSLTYGNWWPGEPNNSGGIEQLGHFYTGAYPTRGDTWNDLGPTVLTNGYVVEAVPEPATLAALGLGALAVLRRRR